uniref:Uncharacterized protein n=1 Tax=Megaselia scalaris TaxID=36166 RepID=T1GCD3_MEGSC
MCVPYSRTLSVSRKLCSCPEVQRQLFLRVSPPERIMLCSEKWNYKVFTLR